ncbi:MAG: Uma2 family endonuclease, partial [Gemmataceae bacterium]
GEKYVSVKPNTNGRCEIPELELEVGLHGGWMRYWFRGELLPLPAELQAELRSERQARLAAEEEVARLRAELEQLKRAGP